MRKWWRELPPSWRVSVISVVVFILYAGGLLLIFHASIGGALFKAFLYTLFLAGGTYFTQKRFRKTAARLEEHGQSLMFLRYPNSRPGALSGVWQMGIANPSPGRIDFQPAVYDELIPSGRSRALTGLHAAADCRPQRHQAWRTGWLPDYHHGIRRRNHRARGPP